MLLWERGGSCVVSISYTVIGYPMLFAENWRVVWCRDKTHTSSVRNAELQISLPISVVKEIEM